MKVDAIPFEARVLSSGLRAYRLLSAQSPFASVVLAYEVGAAHELPHEAGVAHLLEHLLFEDERIRYDQAIQEMGGSTNAYTGQDYTVYYAQVPSDVAELPLCLEAERFYRLALLPEKIAIQRQVVAEEFRQRYLNRPYGQRHAHLCQMLFSAHPYEVMVIGRTPEELLKLPDEAVQTFYQRYYGPERAYLVVSGPVLWETIEAYFSEPKSTAAIAPIPSVEALPLPNDALITVSEPVPQPAVIWAYRLPPLEDPRIPAIDLLDDYLAGDVDGVLVQKLVQGLGVATRLHSYTWQMHAGGMWVLEAYLAPGVSHERFEEVLASVLSEALSGKLQSVLDFYRPMRYTAVYRQRETGLDRALALAHSLLAGHLEWFTDPIAPYEALMEADLRAAAETLLVPARRVRLHYYPSREG